MRFQTNTVLICLIINLIDGFDVLAISFAAPQIAEDWSLEPTAIGFLISVGLAGMVFASIFIAGIADYLGRYKTILLCLGVITLGMVGSATAESTSTLAAWRFLVGLGVGTILPSLNTLVAEFSPAHRRELSVALMQAGYPAGAILGGIVAVIVSVELGWRGIFWIGASLSGAVLLVAWRLLPESAEFLLSRRPAGALARINALYRKQGVSEIGELPPVSTSQQKGLGYRGLMQPEVGLRVALLSLAFFFVMASFYFVAGWTPKLLVDAGLALREGLSGAVILHVGGILGGLILGACAPRFGAMRLTAGYMIMCIPMMLLFASTTDLLPMLLTAFVMGYFLVGSMMGLYVLTPALFAAETRATATGVALGLGRFGAILAPLLTGFLLAADWTPADLYRLFAAPMFISATMALLLWRISSPRLAN